MDAGDDAAFAAILAGGDGARIGGSKPAVLLAGRALIEYAISSVQAAGLAPLVVARLDSQLPHSLVALGAKVVLDPPGPVHPLSGVVAALEHVAAPVVVIAGDMPLVPPMLIDALARERGNVAVKDGEGRLQPLLARYEVGALPALKSAVADGRGATRTLVELNSKELSGSALNRFGEPAEFLLDVDTAEDLVAVERLLER